MSFLLCSSSDFRDTRKSEDTELLLSNLHPYTVYTVRVWAENAVGQSMQSSGWSQPVRTLSGGLYMAHFITVCVLNHTSLFI